ncbi:tripartite ATP-independent transporter DctM subunit [Natranaerovirga hydrolytica]|uniref:Tripartite ATP-independent transporter DctM subunit n=1 Tax=Natranaerovirga hydrolytica TaxID=680378 RepID=A0A4R1MIC0_9FIRM|nr:TRAP transporter large permease [Natranaerovirga hydrolytica]TCK92366.1 tripartite ATP-independent transporter DctM subunit [Natranaerovirga hydrolytica]
MNEIILMTALVLLVLLFFKVPVYIAILGGSMMYFLMTPNVNPILFAQQSISGAESISLLAIPFFVGAGVLMNYSGVTKRIMDFAEVLTGRMSGGLAQVNILLSAMMGGLSGSNIADAAMQSKMLVPQMREKGFSNAFSTVVTATSSMITPLIPPGIAMIIYGSIANVSIGRLFVAGIGIGTLLTASLMILISIVSKKRGYKPIRTERLTLKESIKTTRPALLPLMLPIIIIGGIRLGVFTATEAGSVAILFALLLGIIYRELKKKDFIQAVKETVTTTSAIMLIVAAATVFSWILTRERVPQQLTEWIVSTIDNKYIFLLIVNIFLLIVGMFIEGNASMIILVPLLVPIAREFGINDIHFAMTYIFNNAVGALSPPMGTLMFVTCGITKCKTKDFIKAALPFYGLLLVIMLLITYVPFFSTFLVDLIY